MATVNPFDLLAYDDNEDPTLLIAALQKVAPTLKKAPAPAPLQPAKLPSKPLPPAEAVRGARNEASRGGGRGFGRRGGREGGFSREPVNNGNSLSGNNVATGGYNRRAEDGDGGKTFERRGGYGGPRADNRGGYGGRRGGFNDNDAPEGERPRRTYDRRSGTGHGNETKRDGGGRGNWGTQTDEVVQEVQEPVNENEKTVETDKQVEQEVSGDAKKENTEKESEEKEPEPEDKEMTLEEYEKVLEEKRKALQASKTEERKVPIDKEFESMQLLSSKKTDAEIFVKLGSEKDKRKDVTEKEERAKKSVSINEFLKPAEGEAYYGRGRGRGGRGRGGSRPGYGGGGYNVETFAAAPSINEANFPSLGGK
ncbi:RGG repeats nuclear RNA binding protein A-like [Impatiens glandulifera]|uniref:RGG repeats nuclear RNA binding protein A-like n=1 Tax=Impatiens glandulifera TaxID=253017 RepID=UPI001FB116F4|nr:RGG repeats nuclear RNA binding protein A-like [Impatiens glandulifera]